MANPTSLDPLKYNVFGSFNVYSLVYSTLYRWDEDGNLHPELASDQPEVSEDGLRYTIPLRDDVTWHDGSRFTSEDVAHTLNAIIDPENGATWYAALSPIKQGEHAGRDDRRARTCPGRTGCCRACSPKSRSSARPSPTCPTRRGRTP